MLATTMWATLATTRASFAPPRSLGASVRPLANRRFAHPVSSSPATRRVRIHRPGSAVSAANWPGLSDADAKKKTHGGGGDKKRDGKPRGGAKGGRGKSSGRGGGGRGNSTPNERARSRGRGRGRGKPSRDVDVTADGSKAWRLFDVKLSLEDDAGKDSFEVTPALRDAACAILGLPVGRTREDGRPLLCDGPGYGVRIVRKSCDARSVPPVFSYVLDVDDVAINSATVATGSIKPLKIRVRPKKCVRVSPDWDDGGYDDAVAEAAEPDRIDEDVDDEAFDDGFAEDSYDDVVDASSSFDASSERVVVVGLGPAGLFAALSLAEEGIPTTVLERGQPVESRGRDIGALFARRVLDPDSNLCYGEGGAGTWSDGKLTTRIGRNSDDVRSVLRALVAFGAPREILVTGKPHLGTDRLVRILRNARGYLASRGVDLRFGQTAERVVFEPAVDEGDGRVARAVGVRTRTNRRDAGGSNSNSVSVSDSDSDASFVPASAVVLAAGHSARGLFEGLHEDGVELRYQSFAAGFRIEHPQELLNAAQYGADLAPLASRGRGPLPVADYRLAHQCVGPPGDARDGARRTAVRTPPVARVTLFACVPAGRSFPRARIPPSCASTACRSASDPADGPTADSSPQSRRKTRFRSSRARAANPSPAWISSDTSSARRPSWAAAISSRPCRRRPTSSRGDSPARKICPRRVTVWASSQRDSISCTRRESPRRFASLCWRSTRRFRGTRGPRRCFTRRRRGRVRPCASRDRRTDGMSTTAAGLFPAGEGAGYAGGIVSAAVDGLAAADAVEKFVAVRSERGLGAWA